MKKILSVFLAILIMVTSCVCGLNVFAAEPCKEHVVNLWKDNNNKKNHVGECTKCGQQVKGAHELVVKDESKDKVEATCTDDGYTVYSCNSCTYSEVRDVVKSTGHLIKSTTYEYDVVNNKYLKTIECFNCGDDAEPVEGTVGNSNYCPLCREYVLLGKTVYSATCKEPEYTDYNCSKCGVYPKISDNSNNIDCIYRTEEKAATCEGNGSSVPVCVMCGEKNDDESYVFPAKGHVLNKAGKTTIYTYNEDGTCTVSGYCSVCYDENKPEMYTDTKLYATAEKCTGMVDVYENGKIVSKECGRSLVRKTVAFPANCEDSVMITTVCTNNCMVNKEVSVGHSAEKTTYEYYDNGELKSVTVECSNGCNGASEGDELNTANTCTICSSTIKKRVVIAPTCNSNGYTKIYCPECGVYTESTKNSLSHNATYGEYIIDKEAGSYIFRANCTRKGCNGYTFNAAIGNMAKCTKCGGKDTLTYKKLVYSDCYYGGYTEAICSRCCYDLDGDNELDSYIAEIKAEIPHNLISETREATCVTGGVTVNACLDCYYIAETNRTDPLGHKGNVKQITYDGKDKTITGYNCQRCGAEAYTITEENYPATEDDCINGHKDTITSKLFVEPDCLTGTPGYTREYCKYCLGGYNDTNVVPAVHEYGGWIVVEPATCVKKGIKERICKKCNSKETDEIPIEVVTIKGEDGTITVSPKHKYIIVVKGKEATCTKPGISDEMYCSSCGDYQKAEKVEPLGHLFDTDGKNKNFCDRCDSYIVGEGTGAVSCSCMCHNKDGLAKFFFKFILFFSQIFGINKSCACGTIHY